MTNYNFEGLTAAEEVSKPLQGTMEQAAKQNPDSYGESIEIGNEFNVKPYDVSKNPEPFKEKKKLKSFNFDGLVKSSPGTAQYLQDFNAAAVSQDDTPALERIEQSLKDLPLWTTFGLFARGSEAAETLITSPKVRENIGEQIKLQFQNQMLGAELSRVDRAAEDPINPDSELGQLFQNSDGFLSPKFVDPAERADDLLSQILSNEARVSEITPRGMNVTEEGIRGGIVSLANQLPAIGVGLLTRRGTGMLGTMGAQVYADSYGQARASGLEENDARTYGAIQAAIELGTERLPTKTLETIITSPNATQTFRNIRSFMIQEGLGEQLATLGQTITDYAYGLDEQLAQAETIQEKLAIQARRQAVTAVATVIAGTPQAGGAAALQKINQSLMSEEQRRAMQNETEQLQLDAVQEVVEQSKTKQRSPTMFRKFLQEAVNAGQKEVYLDAVQTRLYLNSLDKQTVDADPVLSSLRESLNNDAAPNGEIAVGLDRFATDFVGSEHYDALRPHMKLSLDSDTQFRAKTDQEERFNYLQRMVEQAEEKGSIYVENQQIFNDIVTQMEETGVVSPKMAKYYAKIVPAYVTVKADELGITPLEMYEKMGLKIEGPYQDRKAAMDLGFILDQAKAAGYQGRSYREAAEWVEAQQRDMDMSQEARMQRAQEMGFDTQNVYYHGTMQQFDEFKPGVTFFTTDPRVAEEYAGVYRNQQDEPFSALSGNQSVPVYLRAMNPLEIDARGSSWSTLPIDDIPDEVLDAAGIGGFFSTRSTIDTTTLAEAAAKTGYDAIKVNNVVDGIGPYGDATPTTVVATTDQTGVRSVNAAFDPDYVDSPDLLAQGQRAVPLQGAPETVNVPGRGDIEFGVFEPAIRAAEEYARRSGIPYRTPEVYAPLDPERAEQIAWEFDRMDHNPNDPEVKAAYKAMIDETLAQFEVILETGLQIEFIRGEDPYANSPREMNIDVIENNHMWVFSTRDGFGSNDKFDPKDNPLLQETEYNIDGVQLLANDVFRIVHDYFGHVKTGVGFRARGEENAWQAHASMYSPLARRAMTTETRGQNSWVNFGPFGEQNRTATAEDTIFADQKIGLLPIWVSEDGRLSAHDRRQRYEEALRSGTTGFEGAIDERGRVELVHYSRDQLTRTDSSRWGQGASRFVRSETNRRLAGAPARTFFGVESATTDGYRRETSLGTIRHVAKVPGELIYDARKDPDNLYNNDIVEFEQAIKAEGYMGYLMNGHFGKVVALFDDVNVEHKQVYNQDPNLQYNSLGLYSTVEKAFNDMMPQGWKKSQVSWTSVDQAEFDMLSSGITSTADPQYERLQALNLKRRKALGLAAGNELWAKISKTPGVKKEELDWMGLEDFLTADPKARFTREEVLNFVRNNGVELYETRAEDGESMEDFQFDWEQDVDDNPGNWEGRAEDFRYEAERGDFDWMPDADQWFDEWFLEHQSQFWDWMEEQQDRMDEDDHAEISAAMTEWFESGSDTEFVMSDVLENTQFDVSDFQYLLNDISDYADEIAEQEYMDNPYYVWRDNERKVMITGNGDIGYSTFVDGEQVFQDAYYHFSDAEQDLIDHLRENGQLRDSGDETVAKWREHVVDAVPHDNYRELKLKFDPPEGSFNYDVHFPDDNILAFLRVTDRDLKAGLPPQAEDITLDLPPVYKAQLIDETDPRAISDTIPGDLWVQQFGKTFSEVIVGDSNDADITQFAQQRVIYRWDNATPKERAKFWNVGEAARVKQSQEERDLFLPDAEEQNTYFIDEFQSDWHQQGRQKGYSRQLSHDEKQQVESLNERISEVQRQRREMLREAFRVIDEGQLNLPEPNGNEPTFIDLDVPGTLGIRLFAMNLPGYMVGRGAGIRVEGQDNFDTFVGMTSDKPRFIDRLTSATRSLVRDIYQDELNELTEQRESIEKVQSSNVPDAPFKDDAWINLGLKRALVDAVENGYDAFSWVDSGTLEERWSKSYRQIYVNQYDRKMVKMVQKLTGETPVHLDYEGNKWGPNWVYTEGKADKEMLEMEYMNDSMLVNTDQTLKEDLVPMRMADGTWNLADFTESKPGYWTIPITDKLREQVQSEGFSLFQERKSRGYYSPENTLIRLNESADASTFLHEFAHFMLDMERRTGGRLMEDINSWFERNAELVAEEANVAPETVIEWLRNGPRAGLTAEQYEAIDRATHEQFARGFETYLMEGKAPSIELRNVFRVFARMLRSVYEMVAGGLNKPRLDDEMRQVFDRLLATDEQIAAEEARSRYEPLFTDAVMAGMTEDQYQQYLEKSRKASDTAKEDVRTKLLKELKRDTKKWWNAEKNDLIEQNIIDIGMQDPVYAARERLLTDPFKMDRVMVRDILGVDKIPPALRGMTITGKRGVTPDDAAALLGFDSGAELVNAVVNARPIREVAEERAEQQMIQRHGDLMNDGRLEEMAAQAARNEERADVILTEIRQLNRSTGTPNIDKKTIQYLAARQISKLSMSQLRPDRYRRAEIRSAQEAATAMANGDAMGALRSKTQQVMNMYLWREAMNARDNADKILRHMAKFRKKAARERIAKAGNGYWEQIQSILSRFEFRRSVSMVQTEREKQAITDWFNERTEEGDNIVLSAEVMAEAYRKHWKELPIDELIGVYESVLSIEHNAKVSNDVQMAEEKITFENAVTRALDSMSRLPDKYKGQRLDAVSKDNVVRRWIAEQTKVPFMMSWLDGGERVGVMHNLVMEPINQAHRRELELWDTVGRKVVNLLQNRSKDQLKRHDKKLYIPEIEDDTNDGVLRGHQVLAVALNVGNESNLRKLLLGEGWAKDDSEVSIENPKLQAVLKHMTKEDWDLVQGIWDGINELFPMLADVHQRTSGLPLEKVEAMQVVTPFGNYEGGYYPMHYDANRSQRASDNEQKLNEQTLSMFNAGGLLIPSVSTGSRINRTEYYGPVKLSLDVVGNHMHEVIHFITHYEAVKQVNKFIKEPRIAEAIKAKLGKAEYDLLKPWLNDVAKDGRQAQSSLQLERLFGRLRTGTTLGVMGFKASTILIQGSGIFNTMAEVGTKDVWNATRAVLASDKSMAEAYKFAFEKSRILKNRVSTMDREMRNVLESAEGRSGFWATVQNASMAGIGLFQLYGVDTVSWYAGYMKGMRDFEGDESRAIRYADWVVENAQGSGATKDMAAILRNKNKAWQLFTMFMTFFSSLGNMIRDTARGARSGQYSVLQVAGKGIFLFIIPALYEALMREGIPDDEEEAEELFQRVTFNAVMMPVGTQPVLRDALNTAAGFGYNASPVTSIVGDGVESTFTMAGRVADDEEITKAQIKNFSQMVGAMAKVPGVNQAWASGEHLYQVLEEGEDFSTRQLLFGPDRD